MRLFTEQPKQLICYKDSLTNYIENENLTEKYLCEQLFKDSVWRHSTICFQPNLIDIEITFPGLILNVYKNYFFGYISTGLLKDCVAALSRSF